MKNSDCFGCFLSAVALATAFCNTALTLLTLAAGGRSACQNHSPHLVLEMSTVSPETSRELHKQAVKIGVDVMDVAISGSTPAAEQGTLTLLVGGNEQLFYAAQPIFDAIARQYFHLGPSGLGTTMKLVVNTLLGVGMQAIAEAVVFGEAAGLNRKLLLEVLSKAAVVAPAHVGKLARIDRNDYSPQFPLSLMNKDFQLILKTSARENVTMPATEAAFRVRVTDLNVVPKNEQAWIGEVKPNRAYPEGTRDLGALIARTFWRLARHG